LLASNLSGVAKVPVSREPDPLPNRYAGKVTYSQFISAYSAYCTY